MCPVFYSVCLRSLRAEMPALKRHHMKANQAFLYRNPAISLAISGDIKGYKPKPKHTYGNGYFMRRNSVAILNILFNLFARRRVGGGNNISRWLSSASLFLNEAIIQQAGHESCW